MKHVKTINELVRVYDDSEAIELRDPYDNTTLQIEKFGVGEIRLIIKENDVVVDLGELIDILNLLT